MSHGIVVNSDAAARPRDLEAIVARITEISTLPDVALKVMEVAQDPSTGAADLTRVVEGDPALGARVLRLVNSAAYGVRTTIRNLHQAISYLGFSQVRNLALTASVSDIFKSDEKLGTYRRHGLWRHLVSVGVCARMIAQRQGMSNFEDAFLAGLLHDIGIILEDQQAHVRFRKVMESLRPDATLIEVEREILGFDHCVLGELLAEAWRFPSVTRAAIRYHHASARCPGDSKPMVETVEIANVLCTLKGHSSVGMKLLRPPLDACQTLGLGKQDLLVLATDLDAELKRNDSLFEL